MAKKAKRKKGVTFKDINKSVDRSLRERNPKNPNYDRAGRWIGPKK